MDHLIKLLFPESIAVWHHQLPPPLNQIAALLLLEHVPFAEEYLVAALVILLTTAIVQLRAFARPPPVPAKRLPKRPLIQIQFQPDDPVSQSVHNLTARQSATTTCTTQPTTSVDASWNNNNNAFASIAAPPLVVEPLPQSDMDTAESAKMMGRSVTSASKRHSSTSMPKSASFIQRIDMVSKRLFSGRANDSVQERQGASAGTDPEYNVNNVDPGMEGYVEHVPLNDVSLHGTGEDDDDLMHDYSDLHQDMYSAHQKGNGDAAKPTPPPLNTSSSEAAPSQFAWNNLHDCLPDSFAPLLSSSHAQILSQQLTADLIHAVTAEACIRMRPGRHEVPLDKDGSRPQLVLHVPVVDGCRITAVAHVGSDGLSHEEDLNVRRPTEQRSKPMVKHAGIVLDPPLPLLNVAPTLIHFPTLFEDRYMIPTLRRVQIVRFVVDFVVSISSFLEKCLWIVESKCQIHLSKIRITPLYKGPQKRPSTPQGDAALATPIHHQQQQQPSPDWRLQLAFSGHVLLFGWVPIPFVNVTLPTFIIPQPHALLDYLLSA